MLQLLLAARKRLGLTQHEMAEKLGISRNYLALIETGKRRVPPHVADQLVTLKQVVVTEPSDQPQCIPEAPIKEIEKLRAVITDLEQQLLEERLVVQEQRGIIRDLSKVLAGSKGKE